MRTLMRWAARLYPATWRNRYGAEFEALLDDISPSLGDVFDVIGDVLRVRATASDACLVLAPVSSCVQHWVMSLRCIRLLWLPRCLRLRPVRQP